MIDNPEYFEDKDPYKMTPIVSKGVNLSFVVTSRILSLCLQTGRQCTAFMQLQNAIQSTQLLAECSTIFMLAECSTIYYACRMQYNLLCLQNAVGLELWSMSDNILFDNFIITDDKSVADAFAADSWELKHVHELSSASGVRRFV